MSNIMKKVYLLNIIFLLIGAFICKAQDNGVFISVDDGLKNPEKVIELQLSGISEKIPKDIDKLHNLKIVRLINLNRDYDLSDAFEKLSQIDSIKELYLYGNRHSTIPNQIIKFKNLKKIQLGEALKSNLPDCLKLLSGIETLESINLIDLSITQLPEEILLVKNLKELNIGDSKDLNYERAFELLSHVKNFESLNLAYNSFPKFPESILKLKNLKSLSLPTMYAKINNAETFLILSRLEHLEYLDLSGNMLGNLVDEIKELKNLKTLIIDGNAIVNKPFKRLKKLLPNTKIINDTPY